MIKFRKDQDIFMAIHTLSKEAQEIIEEALQIAHQHQHPEVDSSHLFFALISSSQTGKEWLERSVRDNPEEFLADLNSALSEWYPDSAEFTEPSNSYLRVMRSAEKLASETSNGTLYCSHILQAVFDLDHRLTDWLSSRVTTTAIEVGLIEYEELFSYNDYPSNINNPARNNQIESIEDIVSELNQLIGLKNVKYEVRRLIHYARVQALRQTRGITNTQMSHHVVFVGNPGTGKTTVARLFGRMLKALNLLSSGHVIETDRSGLVGNYIGQTATKTDEKISEALGGVLFIDEAYSLAKEEASSLDFGSEALEIILKRMEDYRDDLAIIVAGYPKPMEKFLRSNEGLRSRFSSTIDFPDFSPRELSEIFHLFCNNDNYIIQEEALALTLSIIESKYKVRDDQFGNARFVRNLFEDIIRNHAMRIDLTNEDPTDMELRMILPEDVKNI